MPEDVWSEGEKDAVRRCFSRQLPNATPEVIDWLVDHTSPDGTAADLEALAEKHREVAEGCIEDVEMIRRLAEYYEDEQETLEEIYPRLPDDLKTSVARFFLENEGSNT